MFKKLAALFAILTLSTTAYANVASFPDIYDTDYGLGIETLVREGIVSGYPDGTFQPERTLNRAEMLKIVVEATASESEISTYESAECFTDVPSAAWFKKYVCFGQANAFVNGYENGTLFRPEQEVNFVEGLKMTLEAFNIDYPATADVWFRGMVETASDDNLIPYSIKSFDKGLTRAEMSDLIARILEHQDGTLDNYLGDRASVRVTYQTINSGTDLTTQVGQEELVIDLEDLEELFNQNQIECPADTFTCSDGTQVSRVLPNCDFALCPEIAAAEYLDYSQANLADAQARGQRPVLFFNAAWCHTCRSLVEELNASLDELPSDVTILSIDYDDNKDLRKEWDVVIQHTLIELDPSTGQEVSRWVGGGIDTVKSQLE